MNPIQVSYSTKEPNFWKRTLNFLEDLLGTPVGIILIFIVVIPWTLLALLFYSLPMWIYDRFLRKSIPSQFKPEETDYDKGWHDFHRNEELAIEREFFEGVDEIEQRADYSGKPYDWEGFVGFKLRTIPTNESFDGMLFGYNMETFEGKLYAQSVNYKQENSELVSIDLKNGTLEKIKQLDWYYWLEFRKLSNSLLITGEYRRKTVEIEIKRS